MERKKGKVGEMEKGRVRNAGRMKGKKGKEMRGEDEGKEER